jgi:hypothetical protein
MPMLWVAQQPARDLCAEVAQSGQALANTGVLSQEPDAAGQRLSDETRASTVITIGRPGHGQALHPRREPVPG